MPYNTKKMKEDAKGRAFAQYWDEDVDDYVPADSPEKFTQKVKDEDVKAELASIKQTQADILQKLEGAIDTQVTGSILKHTMLNNYQVGGSLTIAPGEVVTLLSNHPFSGKTKEWFLNGRADGATGDALEFLTVSSPMDGNFSTTALVDESSFSGFGAFNFKIDPQRVLAEFMKLEVKNTGTEDAFIRNLVFSEERPKGD